MKKNLLERDILRGLSQKRKKIPSKYLYDKIGSELFNKITTHPDYYLTSIEDKIIDASKLELVNYLKRLHFQFG